MSHPITFVCCVESGLLENQTVRMIESLRRWGGRLRESPIFAVTPRMGPPLSRQTHRAFERLGVEYLRFQAESRYPWLGFLNKPYALVAVQERSTSECIGWLDSDLLFLGEPEELILKEGEDFVACAPDRNIGTTGPEDPFEPYWKAICQVVGLDIEDLPWITTEMEGKRIRLYWNSGVFVYRRHTGFAHPYLQTCLQLLDSRLANHNSKIFFTDQVALGLAMVKLGLSWRALSYSHNYQSGSLKPEQWGISEKLKPVRILHHHDAMLPDFFSEFVNILRAPYPDVAEWISSLEPLKNQASIPWRTTSKVLNQIRSRKQSDFIKSCKFL